MMLQHPASVGLQHHYSSAGGSPCFQMSGPLDSGLLLAGLGLVARTYVNGRMPVFLFVIHQKRPKPAKKDHTLHPENYPGKFYPNLEEKKSDLMRSWVGNMQNRIRAMACSATKGSVTGAAELYIYTGRVWQLKESSSLQQDSKHLQSQTRLEFPTISLHHRQNQHIDI